ncbi:MAG: hypothetical protein EA351_08065 [Gemmatimonadales bacterium]|nr:MAG: hypothetical protein EA351_08065 [Gemmatimonadales bacterium]
MRPRSACRLHVLKVPSLLALVLAFAACADGADPDPTVRVDTLGGIEHTVVEDHPERGDEGLEFLWRAPDEATVFEGTEWSNPTRIAMSEDHIAVLDAQAARVHLFTPDGQRNGSFGRSGEGPGELSNPTGLGIHGDSILVTSMMGTPALQWFGLDGSYRGHAGGAGAGVIAAAHFLPGTGILRQVLVMGGGGSGPSWEYVDLDDERHPVELPGNHSMQPHVADGGDGCWRRGTAGPNLVEVDCSFPLVRLIDTRGSVVREHRIDRAPQRTPEDRIEQAIDGVTGSIRVSGGGEIPQAMLDQLMTQQEERLRQQYAWTPVISMVTGSTSGSRIVLLEQIPESLGGGPATLHVLDSDGRYLARHRLDDRVRSIAASDTLLVVMVQDDEIGLRHLEAYRLP